MRIISTLFFLLFLSFPAFSQITAREANKVFAPKGNHRSPFKDAGEAALVSVNIQFKLASRETLEKRGAGNVISWAFLEGVNDQLLQEITDEYYKRLEAKFKTEGVRLTDKFTGSDDYRKLIGKNENREREVNKKNWGVSKIFTANGQPYLEYPIGLAGPHAALGNDLKIPVGQVFITVDFAEFLLEITKGLTDIQGVQRTHSKSTLVPRIRIEGVSQVGKMRGDGTYALFSGKNWGYTNAVLGNHAALHSSEPYALSTEAAKGLPESMKKFKSAVLGDLAQVFSAGVIKNGRASGEFTYLINADPEAYKKAVLDALDLFNNYLFAYINDNR